MTTTATRPPWASTGTRARRLFVVRESDEFDLLLFDAMREQTYQMHRTDPAVLAVMGAGLTPLDRSGAFTVKIEEPDGAQRELVVLTEEIVRGRTRAVLFQVEGVWHLWSMSSAAKTDCDGVNDFTAILIEVIERLRPHHVHAANFSRLIRSHDQGSLLQHKMSGRVDVVHAGHQEFPLTGPAANVGKMMFSMFSTIASMERDWIVLRLLTGKIAKWRRGEWPYGVNTVPFGYAYDSRLCALVPDESLRTQVREMLVVLSQDTSPSAMVAELAKIGVQSMRPHRGRRHRVSVAMMHNPRAFIDSLYAWSPIWICGEYLYRVTTPLSDLTEIAGVSVVRHDETDDEGEFQLLSQVPLPEGGWAEPAVLDAFRAAAMRRTAEKLAAGSTPPRALAPATRGASQAPDLLEGVLNPLSMRGNDPEARTRRAARRGRAVLSLLSGIGWSDDAHSYELQVLRRGMYRLMRRPLEPVATADPLVAGEQQ